MPGIGGEMERILYRWAWKCNPCSHYNDVTMGSMASQITSLTIVYSAVYSGADQRKHQSSASLAFVRGIRRGPANSPHKWSVTRKMFAFDDVIMIFRKEMCVLEAIHQARKLFYELKTISWDQHRYCGSRYVGHTSFLCKGPSFMLIYSGLRRHKS